jgi:nickel transport protein
MGPTVPSARPRRHGLLSLCLAAGAVGLLSLEAGSAQAHAIESSVERLAALNASLLAGNDPKGTPSGTVAISSRFGSGEPAREAVVRLLPPQGEPIELGRTDASGQLRFQLPSQARGDWELQVDAGPGHRDYLNLSEAGLTGDATGQGQARRLPSLPELGLLLGLSAAGLVSLRRWRS